MQYTQITVYPGMREKFAEVKKSLRFRFSNSDFLKLLLENFSRSEEYESLKKDIDTD